MSFLFKGIHLLFKIRAMISGGFTSKRTWNALCSHSGTIEIFPLCIPPPKQRGYLWCFVGLCPENVCFLRRWLPIVFLRSFCVELVQFIHRFGWSMKVLQKVQATCIAQCFWHLHTLWQTRLPLFGQVVRSLEYH